jgi:hypothetical protein
MSGMKKIACGLALSIFLFGCATTRMVTENRFISKNPDVSILVDPAFKYIGSTKYDYRSDAVDGSRRLSNEQESFIFIKERSPVGTVKSMISLSIRTAETAFNKFYYVNSSKNFEIGKVKLGNNNYEYNTRMLYPDMNGGMAKYLKDNGHVFPRCIIIKEYVRIPYPNTAFYIHYIEDLPEATNQCNDWIDREMLKDNQKEFIKSFSKRSQESFKVIDETRDNLNVSSPQKSTKENWIEPAEKIKVLGELLEKGLITQEEYNDKKRKLLEQF